MEDDEDEEGEMSLPRQTAAIPCQTGGSKSTTALGAIDSRSMEDGLPIQKSRSIRSVPLGERGALGRRVRL